MKHAAILLIVIFALPVASALTVESPASDTFVSGTIVLNATTSSPATNVTFTWILEGQDAYATSIINDTPNQDVFTNESFPTILLDDGIYTLNVTSEGESILLENITVDNTPPLVDPAYHAGTLGYGLVAGDGRFNAHSESNRLINLSLGFTSLSGIANLTVNLSEACTGYDAVSAVPQSDVWYASCETDMTDVLFEERNITMSACDQAGNCNASLFRTIALYNLTHPKNGSWIHVGSQTTNLAEVEDLSSVAYQFAMVVNGSELSGLPWTGMRLAALLEFAPIDFTDPALHALDFAEDMGLFIPGHGFHTPTLIFVNTSAFPQFDVAANISVYTVPISAAYPSFVTNGSWMVPGSASTENISGIAFTPAGDGTGNITFTVERLGRGAFEIADDLDPIITVNSPENNTIAETIIFDLRMNATGTQIQEDSVNLTVTSNTSTYVFNISHMNCAYSANKELLDCTLTLDNLSEDEYNFTVHARDYGAIIGGYGAEASGYFTVAEPVSITTITSPANNAFFNESFTINATISGNATSVQYRILNGTNTSHEIVGWSALNAQGAHYTDTISIGSLLEHNYTLVINATDSWNIATATRRFGIDTTPPVITGFVCNDIQVGSNPSCTCLYEDNSESFGGGASHTLSQVDTSTTGIRSITCTVTDLAGNSDQETDIFEVLAPPPDPPTGSDGSPPPPTPTSEPKVEKRSWTSIAANQPIIAQISSQAITVERIGFVLNESKTGVSLTVTEHDTLPDSFDEEDLQVHARYEIVLDGADNAVSEVNITFSIPTSWLEEHEIAIGDVLLFRYADGWEELPTRLEDIGTERIEYTATTSALSYFLAGAPPSQAEPMHEDVEEEQVEEEPVEVHEEEEVRVEDSGEEADVVSAPREEGGSTAGFIAVAVIALLTFAGYIIVRKTGLPARTPRIRSLAKNKDPRVKR